MTPRDLALASLVMVLWGANYVALKVSGTYLPPFTAMAIRFLLVGLCVLFVPLPRGRFPLLALFALLSYTHFGMMMAGIGEVDASTAAILLQAQVPFSTLLGALIYRERPKPRDLVGIAIAFVGTAIIIGQPRGGTPFGMALMVGAAFLWSIATMTAKRLSDLSAMSITTWSALFMAPLMALTSLLRDTGFDALWRWDSWPGHLGVLYMTVGSSIAAYGLWYSLMRRVPLPKLMPTVLMTPAFAVAAGVLLLGEQITLRFLFGAALTIVGLAVVMIRPPRTATEKPAQ